MSLVWRKQFSVANDVIDNDHKYLIDLINLATESIDAKNRRELAAVLDRLTHYSAEHFAREELIARAVGYAKADRLGESHKALNAQLEGLKAEMPAMDEEWSESVAADFSRVLRAWLIDHVIKEDLPMKDAMEKFSPLFDPRAVVRPAD